LDNVHAGLDKGSSLQEYMYPLLFRHLFLSHSIQLIMQQKHFSMHFQRSDMSLHDSDHSLSQLEAEHNTSPH